MSSVDKGAGEGVKVALLKRDFSEGERREAADRGQALPDGSFPIKDKSDLRNAIQAIGRAKNPAKAKAHIKTRARALGATDMLPDSWSKREADAHKALELAVESIGNDPAKLVECFKQFHEFMNASPSQETDMTPEEISKLVADEVAKALAAAAEIDKAKKPVVEPDANDGDDDDAQKAAPVDKAAPVIDTELAKRDAQIIDLTKVVKELRDAQAKEEFSKRATAIGLTSADGEHLRKAYSGDVASLKWMEETIAKLHTQVEKAGLFGEIGSSGGSPATPHDELMAKALELQKADSKLTPAAAYVKAMEMFPEIAKRERETAHAQIAKLAP